MWGNAGECAGMCGTCGAGLLFPPFDRMSFRITGKCLYNELSARPLSPDPAAGKLIKKSSHFANFKNMEPLLLLRLEIMIDIFRPV